MLAASGLFNRSAAVDPLRARSARRPRGATTLERTAHRFGETFTWVDEPLHA
jgi:hypothetical protein